jgi:hypothetical protein
MDTGRCDGGRGDGQGVVADRWIPGGCDRISRGPRKFKHLGLWGPARKLTSSCSYQPGGSGLLRNWSIRAKAAAATLDESSRNKSASSVTRRKPVRSPSSIDSGYESLNTSGRSSPTNASSADESTTPAAPPIEAVQARILKDASRAFFGQINNHSQAAKEKMRCLRVARLVASDRTVDAEE